MIEKKEGIINEIIYDNTVYHNGKYRIYPTIIELIRIIKEITNSKSTTSYLRFNPFYINVKGIIEIEFEDYMFYFECRDHVSDYDIEKHIEACLGTNPNEIDDEQKRIAKILFPLGDNGDIKQYQISLENYIEYLDEMIPQLMKLVRDKTNISDSDVAFGYFCFEVHSG